MSQSGSGSGDSMEYLGEGVTPLMVACQQGRDNEVRQILEHKPLVAKDRDKTGKTALHYCTENQTLHCIDELVTTDRTLLDLRDEEGYCALHLSVISGNRNIIKYLIAKGADVNVQDNEKHSIVHWATVCGELDALDILLDAGANPSTADIHGAFPLHYAAQMCGTNSEMGNDVRLGLAVLRKLLTRGVHVDVMDKDGREPLLWAASAGSADAMLALVNAGAKVESDDKDGLTAIHCAASRGHTDCLETLITLCGSDTDIIDSNGCTALFYATTLGHADCTELLLKFGAEPNRQDRKGRTPAHCGAAKGQLETIKILGKHGANLWVRNVKGELPLHEAVQSGRKDLVRYLLDHRPDAVNVGSNEGRSPLHIAALNNNVEMCKVLIDKNANVNAIMRNSKGQFMTPLDAALYKNNRQCAKYIQLNGGMPASKLTDKTALEKAMHLALGDSNNSQSTSPDVLLSSKNASTSTISPIDYGTQTEQTRTHHKESQVQIHPRPAYSDGNDSNESDEQKENRYNGTSPSKKASRKNGESINRMIEGRNSVKKTTLKGDVRKPRYERRTTLNGVPVKKSVTEGPDKPVVLPPAGKMKRYQLERKIFQELLELKRLQLRGGAGETALVRRLVEEHRKENLVAGLTHYEGPYQFRSFEKYLYDQLRALQGANSAKTVKIPEPSGGDKDQKCHHTAHAYTGIPCVAYSKWLVRYYRYRK